VENVCLRGYVSSLQLVLAPADLDH